MKKDKRNTPYYDVRAPDGSLICRVGFYTDPVIDRPEGFSRFLDYLPVFVKQVEKGEWQGFVFDSVSFASLLARKYHQYSLNPDTNNQLQWFGGATDLIEEALCLQLPSFQCDVGVAYHIHRRKIHEDAGDDDKGGKVRSVKQPFVPGRRLEETKMAAAAWPELYRLYIKEDEGKKRRVLQTEARSGYQAGTCIGLPDGLVVPRKGLDPEWLWQGYSGKDRPPLHIGAYSDPHVGKSTFLAQVIRSPFYVALFDAVGKDMAYRTRGEVRD